MARNAIRKPNFCWLFRLNEGPVKPHERLYRAKSSPRGFLSTIAEVAASLSIAPATEEAVMKAVLALVIIYVGTFFLAIQGASQNPVNAAPQGSTAQSQAVQQAAKAIDPAKDADIRSLMELVGARDQVQEAVANSTEQYREKLLATVPNNEKGQAFVTSFADAYQKKFDVDDLTEQLVTIYDKHYSDDEIKVLLQFYGSPIGQKVAAEMPKISKEIQAASRATGAKAAKEALQAMKAQNPEIGQWAHFANNNGNTPRRWGQNGRQQGQQAQGTQQAAQQPDPQF
jgi:uncharacterized protein